MGFSTFDLELESSVVNLNNPNNTRLVKNVSRNRPKNNSTSNEALNAVAFENFLPGRRENVPIPLNLRDRKTRELIRSSTLLEAHITCGQEASKLLRLITSKDKK